MNRHLLRALCAFIPSRKGRKYVRQHADGWMLRLFPFQYNTARKRMAQEPAFPHYLSIAATVKNEAPYIAEWIEYHKLVGVEKFYIYDNESDDNLTDVLKPYIESGDVDYTLWPGQGQQIPIYNDAVRKSRGETKWLAVIDLDEFLVPLQTETVPELLKEYEDQVGLVVHWLIYGDNGHATKTDGLVIERFTAHSEPSYEHNRHIKSIVNPREVVEKPVHEALYRGGVFAVNEDREFGPGATWLPIRQEKIRLHHYFGKSLEEYKAKRSRGLADKKGVIYSEKEFILNNRNDIRNDRIMEKYVPRIKAALAEKGFDGSGMRR